MTTQRSGSVNLARAEAARYKVQMPPEPSSPDSLSGSGGSAGAQVLAEGTTDLGHRFRWLHTGTAAYAAMITMIDDAERTVDVEFYTVAPGDPADRLGEALQRAAARGLRVRVLIDAFGSSSLPAAWDERLRMNGADVRRFNPRPLLRWSFRDHRKLVVCDGQVALVGGFNVTPAFEGDGIHRGWRDLGVLIEGPLARDLGSGFAALFAAANLEHVTLRPLARLLRRQPVHMDAAAAIIGGPGGPQALLKRILRADLRSAQRVDVAAAYFLPSRRMRRLLRQAARRGPVRVLLSENSDVPVARLASQHLYRRLLRSGVDLWEYRPQVMHAKALVVDDVVYVGSANLDTRSLQLNFELLVRLPSPVLASQIRARIDQDCTLARRVPPDWPRHRTPLQRLLQSWSYFLLTRVDPFVARRQFRHLR
jgi:cardiolipin synthase